MAGVAHRVTACYDCLLEDLDADAAARRVFERLFVRDGEVVLLETVKRGTESAEVRKQVCQGALTQRQTLESWFERARYGLLERLQRRVAPETLRESGSSFGTEVVSPQAAWWSAEVVWCQRALAQKQTLRVH